MTTTRTVLAITTAVLSGALTLVSAQAHDMSGAASGAASSASSGASNAAANAASNAAAAAANSAINSARGRGRGTGAGAAGMGATGPGTIDTLDGAVAIANAILGKDPVDPVQAAHEARVKAAKDLDAAWKQLDNQYNDMMHILAKRDYELTPAEKIAIDRAGGIGAYQAAANNLANQRDATFKQWQAAQAVAVANNSYNFVP